MSRLFLASFLDVTIEKFISIAQISDATKLKVAFIDLAADPYKKKSDLIWVKKDREAFTKTLFQLIEIDLKNYSGDFCEFDIIHFCGGHTRYLLSQLHKLGHFDSIKQAVLNHNVIYTGTSAGSMIAAPSLDNIDGLDDEILDEYVHNNTIISSEKVGLGLVDFLMLPHFDNPEFISTNYKSIQSTNYPHPLMFVNDKTAIWVQDNWYQIIQI